MENFPNFLHLTLKLVQLLLEDGQVHFGLQFLVLPLRLKVEFYLDVLDGLAELFEVHFTDVEGQLINLVLHFVVLLTNLTKYFLVCL